VADDPGAQDMQAVVKSGRITALPWALHQGNAAVSGTLRFIAAGR